MENKMTNNTYLENKTLKEEVKKDTAMKEWLVDYVGTQFLSEMKRINAEEPDANLEWDGAVTVEMIIEMMSIQFPEFLMAVAEENFIRGYTQAMADLHEPVNSSEE